MNLRGKVHSRLGTRLEGPNECRELEVDVAAVGTRGTEVVVIVGKPFPFVRVVSRGTRRRRERNGCRFKGRGVRSPEAKEGKFSRGAESSLVPLFPSFGDLTSDRVTQEKDPPKGTEELTDAMQENVRSCGISALNRFER